MLENINVTRNIPAPSREWKNSMYSYNENTLVNSSYNDVIANNIVNMTLHLTLHKKVNTKSKRMRDLIRRNTTRQLIVGKPDVKQTSDKAIVTVYIFDREKTMYVRRLYFVKDSINKSIINSYTYNKKQTNISSFINKIDSNNVLGLNDLDQLNLNNLIIDSKNDTITQSRHNTLVKLKEKYLKRIKKKLLIRIKEQFLTGKKENFLKKIRKYKVNKHSNKILSKSMKRPNKRFERLRRLFLKKLSYKYKINNKMLTRTVYKSFLNKKSIINNLFMFKFLKWVLSCFNIKIYYCKANKKLSVLNAANKLRTIRLKNNVLLLTNNTVNNQIYNINGYLKLYKIPKVVSLLKIRLINKIMFAHVKTMITHYIDIDNNMRVNLGIRKLFDLYRNKYLMRHSMFFLRKQRLTLSYLAKLYNNKLKYNNLIHGFKLLLSNVYNKSIKLNLVNLKYLHLNSDIFSEAVSIKLRKKNNRLLRIIKKALRLVKIPKIVSHNPKIQNIVKFTEFNWYGVNNDLNKNNISKARSVNDMLDNLLLNMFPKEINYDKHQLSHNIIYSIKHKWVRGVRLEAKGRLTKRYTASRSLFKFRYKGTLRNLEHLKKPYYNTEQASVVMLRNSIRPNVQYTFTASRKRIGVYGIKGWISGY